MFTRLVTQAGTAIPVGSTGLWTVQLVQSPGALAYDPTYDLSLGWDTTGSPGVTARCVTMAGNSPPSEDALRMMDQTVAALWLTAHHSHYPYTATEAQHVRATLGKLPRLELRELQEDEAAGLLDHNYAVIPRWSTAAPAYLYWDAAGQWVASLDGQVLDRRYPATHPDVNESVLLVESDPRGNLWVLDCLMFQGLVVDHPRALWGEPSDRKSTLRGRLLQAEWLQAAYALIRAPEQPQLWLHRTRGCRTADELMNVLEGVLRLAPTATEAWFAPAYLGGPIYHLDLASKVVDYLRGVGYERLRTAWEHIDEVLFQSLDSSSGGSAITIFCLPTDAERYRRLAAGFDTVHIITGPEMKMPISPVVAIFATWLWESRTTWETFWGQMKGLASLTIIFRCWDGPACERTCRPLTGVSRDAVVFTETLAASQRAGKTALLSRERSKRRSLPPAGIQWAEGRLQVSIPGIVPAGTYALGWSSDLQSLGTVRRAEHHLTAGNGPTISSQKERWLSKLQRYGRFDLSMSTAPLPALRRGSPEEVDVPGAFTGEESKVRAGPHNQRPYRVAYTYVRQNSVPDRYVSIPHNDFVLPLLPTLLDDRIEQVGCQWYEPVYRLATVADGTCLIHSVLQGATPEYQDKDNRARAAMGKSVRCGLGLLLEEKASESEAGEQVYTYADGGANASVFASAGDDVKSPLYREVKLFSLPGLQSLYRSDAFLGNETLTYLSYVFGVVIHQFVGYGKFGLRDHIVYQTPAYQPRKHIAIVGLGAHFETLAVFRNGYLVTVFDEDDEFLTSIPAPAKV